MKRTHILLSAVLLLFVMISPAWAAGGHKLTDHELDQIAAGDFSMQFADQKLNFNFDSGLSATQARVSGKGSLDMNVLPMSSGCGTASSCSISNVILGTNAQSGVQSLANVIAVNSIVNVLLNLNVNVAQPGSTQNIWGGSQTNSLAGLFK